MSTSLVEPERVRALNHHDPREGDFVLYWMQASVRTRDNPALEYAARTANGLGLPLLVCFGLDPDYEEATPRTFGFLVDGLIDVARALDRRGIAFALRIGAPLSIAAELSSLAAAVVTDRNYLKAPRAWRRELADDVTVPVWEVEANVVVPVEVASDSREWAARTLRPKIHEHLERFVVELRTTPLEHSRAGLPGSLEIEERERLLAELGVGDATAHGVTGGQNQAYATLESFLDQDLDDYGEAGARVIGSPTSRLSAYLHFGQISPVEIVRRAHERARGEALHAFVEELVVRRELAHNYVWFEPDYDSYRALPDWARITLDEHRDDERPAIYTRRQLEGAKTEDAYWNAAMVEMRETGYLHNRMRMYWGKRILEWANTPEHAFRVALELNNRHLLDGRDPNSFANIGWLFGLHDQPFKERAIFGKTRPMTASGLERKIDAKAYVAHVEQTTGVAIA